MDMDVSPGRLEVVSDFSNATGGRLLIGVIYLLAFCVVRQVLGDLYLSRYFLPVQLNIVQSVG